MFEVKITHSPEDSGYLVQILAAQMDGPPRERNAWHVYGFDGVTRGQAYETARQYAIGATEAFRAMGARCDHNLSTGVLHELRAIREAEKETEGVAA